MEKTTKTKTNVTAKVKTSNKKNVTINLAGRNACSAYFEKSGIRYGTKQGHNPFIVFNERETGVETELVDNAKDLIKYPNNTKVMGQWMGKERSDFVQFTVGDLKKHIKANPPRTVEAI